MGFVHRDIKTDNIVLGSNFEPKIIDFGLSNQFTQFLQSGLVQGNCGTAGYEAPEILSGIFQFDGIKVDIFAAAVVLFHILTATRPFDRAKQEDEHYSLIMD